MRDQIQQTVFGRYIVIPVWDAIWRLSQPEVRMVTGGIAFYALFSIFPLAYLTTALLFTLLPSEWSGQLALAINQIVASNIMPLDSNDLDRVAELAPQSITLGIIITLILVIWAAMAVTKATITGYPHDCRIEKALRGDQVSGDFPDDGGVAHPARLVARRSSDHFDDHPQSGRRPGHTVRAGPRIDCRHDLDFEMAGEFSRLFPADLGLAAGAHSWLADGVRGGRQRKRVDVDHVWLPDLSRLFRARHDLWRAGIDHSGFHLAVAVDQCVAYWRGARD